MTYQFHIRTPSTAAVEVAATVVVEDNRPDRTELLREKIAEFYQVPTMWVKTRNEYRTLLFIDWVIERNSLTM